jgi:hypothetical protein
MDEFTIGNMAQINVAGFTAGDGWPGSAVKRWLESTEKVFKSLPKDGLFFFLHSI